MGGKQGLARGACPPEAMMESLRINERKNATVTALAERGETILRENPDVPPTVIGIVVAGPTPAQRKGVRESEKGSNAPRQQREQRIHSYSVKFWHLIQD